jgi:hypothetical protein
MIRLTLSLALWCLAFHISRLAEHIDPVIEDPMPHFVPERQYIDGKWVETWPEVIETQS